MKTPIPGPRSKVSGCGTGSFSALELTYLHYTLHPQPTGIVGRSQQDSGIIICNENMFLRDPSRKLDVVGVVIIMLSLSTDYPAQYFGSGCPIFYHCSMLPVPIQMKSQLLIRDLGHLSTPHWKWYISCIVCMTSMY